MEESGANRNDVMSGAVRRRRSHRVCRRPDSEHEPSPSSQTPPSDDASKGSIDETISGEANFTRKEFNLNQCVRIFSSTGTKVEKSLEGLKEYGGDYNGFYSNEIGHDGLNNESSREGILAPADWKSSSSDNGENQSLGQSGVASDGSGNENKVKKIMLKIGGVARVISSSNGELEHGSSRRVKHMSQENVDHENSSSGKRTGLQGIPWKDFSRAGFSFRRQDSAMGKSGGKSASGKQGGKSEPVRKSKRMPKKRVMDDEFDDDEDDEVRYLLKLRGLRSVMGNKESDEESDRKQRKLASVSDICRDGKRKSRTDGVAGETDYEEEEEAGSDGNLEKRKTKKQKKESIDYLMGNDSKGEMTLTIRQRAMQSSKDASAGLGHSLDLEFPNGLPPAPPRKQKEKLSEVEQQLKKAEAAQRRRLQNEKAARESEAEAIRKILGQDSNRKKREEKTKKRQEALAEEKAANAAMLASNTVRWVMGPSGTVVIFPNEMGLPEIFRSKTSYPPPRENCAGPSCANPYKYRDSKTKLPLCSLHCYKAVQQQKLQAKAIC